jgi:uncharacterized protein
MRSSLVAVAGLSLLATAALAQTADDAEFRATTLSLSATGEVRAAPDLAQISVGVENQGANAAEAVARNRREMAAVVAALHAQGVADPDIQTENLSLQPQYTFQSGQPRQLTGYQATNEVSVRLHDLSRVGQVVDALVAAGANQINSIDFEISDRTPVEDAARQAALKALAAKAALYAQASGYHIARLVRLQEGSAPTIQPLRRMIPGEVIVTGSRLGAPTPVAAGELTVSETVSAEYELTR